METGMIMRIGTTIMRIGMTIIMIGMMIIMIGMTIMRTGTTIMKIGTVKKNGMTSGNVELVQITLGELSQEVSIVKYRMY